MTFWLTKPAGPSGINNANGGPKPEQRGNDVASDNAKNGNELATFGDAGTRMATSLNLDKPDNRRALARAMGGDLLQLTEQVNAELDIANYLVHEYDKSDEETGEVTRLVRLVVFSGDGTPLQCVSKTLLNSLKHLTYAFGPCPWDPPLKVKLRMKRKGENVQIYWFEPVE